MKPETIDKFLTATLSIGLGIAIIIAFAFKSKLDDANRYIGVVEAAYKTNLSNYKVLTEQFFRHMETNHGSIRIGPGTEERK